MNKTKSSVLIELQYFPCTHYFSMIGEHDSLILEAHETFQKQSYRNRTHILSAQKVEKLLIPVLSGNSHLPIKEVRIDHSQKWRLIHQRAIQSAYGKSAFFEHYGEDILSLYDKPVAFLFDFNREVLTLCLKLLKWDKKIILSTDYQKNTVHSETGIVDFRDHIHPKKQLQTALKPYQQVFGRQFEPNLSILDLLFCEGNNCNPYLKR